MKISMRPVERVGCPTTVQFGIPTFGWGGLSPCAVQVNMTVAECDTFMGNLVDMLNGIDAGNRGRRGLWGRREGPESPHFGCSCDECESARSDIIAKALTNKNLPVKIEQMHDQTFSGGKYHLMEHLSPLVGKIHELVDAVNEIREEGEE